MDNEENNLDLGEAASRYLASLADDKRGDNQPEINKFVRWNGSNRLLERLAPSAVANYAERLSLSDTDYMKKLERIRAFLVYVKKQGWTKTGLSVHLKARKGRIKTKPGYEQRSQENVALSQQGFDELKAELADLKERSTELIEEIRIAAADKDFKENAPLQAAREERGKVEGRVLELEETMKLAVIVEGKGGTTSKISVGDKVVLCDLATGEEMNYILVNPRETDISKGRISNASPIGQAVIGKSEGETVEVVAPAGKLSYQIKKVKK